MAILEYKCKCERCGKEFVFHQGDEKINPYFVHERLWDTDYCSTCNDLHTILYHALMFPERRRTMNPEDPMTMEDYISMCYLYAKGYPIYVITDLFRLPESVVRAIIFDVKDGETSRAVDVRGALNKQYNLNMNSFHHKEEEDK